MRWQGADDPAGAGRPDRAGRAGMLGRAGRRDLIGLLLAGAIACWALIAAAVNGGAAAPVIGLVAASTALFAVARVFGSIRPWIVPGAVVLAAGVLAVAAGSDVLSREPLSGPLGYANADAAFYLLATIAALLLVATLPGTGPKVAAGLIAIAYALVTVSKDSTAASALLALAALGFVVGSRVSARSVVAVCLAVFVTVLGVTVVLAAAHRSELGRRVLESLAAGGLSERRIVLWDEALVLMLEHPVSGVGPGRFPSASPTAIADRDARWAHEEFLQQGAELGIPGFVLVVGLFLWGFWRLASVRNPDRVTSFGAIALAAIGVQASVDYILHFPPVGLAMAALLGAATVDRDVDTRQTVLDTPSLPARGEEVGRR